MVKIMYDKNILIVDDEKNITSLLEIVLKKEGFKNIFIAETGAEAIIKNDTYRPDIIILDVMLPDMNGFEVCSIIREYSMVPILFLSARTAEDDRLHSYLTGGDEYITKPFSIKEIVCRIKAVLKRQQYYEKKEEVEVFKIEGLEVDKKRFQVKKNGKLISLTAREYAILFLLIDNAGIVVSKSTILENVWGTDYDGYDNTLMVHMRRLREKIEDDPSHPKYIHTVKGIGYKFSIKGEFV